MRRKGVVLACLVCLLAGGVVLYVNRKTAHLPAAQSEDRSPLLKELVALQEKESAQAVAEYLPKNKTQLDDLNSPVDSLLRRLPGVVEVEVAVETVRPRCRTVHLRDWHYVPKDLFAIDMKQAHGQELNGRRNRPAPSGASS